MEQKQESKKAMTLRERQAAESRERLLLAATQLFIENGYQATSVRSINRVAGVADGLLYHYFPGGKKELLGKVTESHFREVLRESSGKDLAEKYEKMPIDQMMEAFFENMTFVFEKHMQIFQMVFREPEIRRLLSEEDRLRLFGQSEFKLQDSLRRRIAEGELREFDVDAAAQSVVAMLISCVFSKLLGADNLPIFQKSGREQLVRYYVSLWKN